MDAFLLKVVQIVWMKSDESGMCYAQERGAGPRHMRINSTDLLPPQTAKCPLPTRERFIEPSPPQISPIIEQRSD